MRSILIDLNALFWLLCAIWGLYTFSRLTRLLDHSTMLLEAFLGDSLHRQSSKAHAEAIGIVSDEVLPPGIYRFDMAEKEFADGLREERDKKARRYPYEGEMP